MTFGSYSGRRRDTRRGRLGLTSARMQDPFGIAVWLFASLEDKIASRVEGRSIEAWRHRAMKRIAGVLLIDDSRHAFQGFENLGFADHLMAQPVGDMLARNAERRAIFHETYIVQVGHFR